MTAFPHWNHYWAVLPMFRLLPVLLPLSFGASLSCRFSRRTVITEIEKERAPALHRGPIFSSSQNGAASEALPASSEAAEPEVFASGSGSPRSSLRTTSARIDHDVIFAVFAVFAFLPLPFGC